MSLKSVFYLYGIHLRGLTADENFLRLFHILSVQEQKVLSNFISADDNADSTS